MAPSADQSRAPSSKSFVSDASRRLKRLLPSRRRRTVAVVLVAAAVTTSIAGFAVGPIVRSVAGSRAKAMGLRIAIHDSSIGWGALCLDGVTVRSAELPGVAAELHRVEVAPGITGGIHRIRVHGATVTLQGSLAKLEEEVRAYRVAHAQGSGSRAGPATSVFADGIDLTWSVDDAARTSEHAWGIRYQRDADGSEHVGADLVRIVADSLHIEMSKPSASFDRDGDSRRLTVVGAERVATTIDVSDEPAEAVEPREVRAPPAPSAPKLTTPADGAEGRWLTLRSELTRAADSAARLLRPSTSLALPDVRFEVKKAGQVLNIGPARAALERTPEAVKVAVTTGDGERSTPIRFDIDVPLGAGPVDIGLAGGPVSLSALGVQKHDMGLEDLERADVEVNGRVRLEADGRSVHLSGGARLSDLSLLQPRLSKEVIRGLRLGVNGDADVALDGSNLRFSGVGIEVGKVKLIANGTLVREEGHAQGALHLEIPLAACSDMLSSVPTGLIPLLSGLEMSGTFTFSGDLAFDTRKPKETHVVGDAANGCKITRVPVSLSTDRFSHPWTRSVLDSSGLPTTIDSGPGTATWVPGVDISPYVATAVVVCEDANFYSHGGFNQKSIQDSIRDDLTAGRFVRGGSTVTMQLAKNLYLKREKTLSRKLQEAVLTVLLEQSLTKEEILELYLNVIEFAPGLYGIGPAAEHYFHSSARALSLGQALYLVSLLPNPKIHHFKPDGSLSDRWAEYLRHLMEIAHKIRRIDDRELATALAEEIHRGVAAGDGESAGGGDDALEPPDRDPDGP